MGPATGLTLESDFFSSGSTFSHNPFQGSGRTDERSGILLQIERAADASDGDVVCYVFSLEDAVAHPNTSSGEIEYAFLWL